MDSLRLLHLLLLSVWAGAVLVEVLIEIAGKSRAATLHYWTDVLFELPLIAGILTTGALLASRVWPPTPLLAAKLACGLLAISANLYCAVLVLLRYRRREDEQAVQRLSARILRTGVGIPFGLAAAWLGFAYFHVGG